MFFMDATQKKWNCWGKLSHTHPLLFLSLLATNNKKLLNTYIWHSGCPKYQITFIVRSVGDWEVWFQGDYSWLFHYKKPHNHPAVLLNFFKLCPPVVFIWCWLFFSCLSPNMFEWGEDRQDQILPIMFSKNSIPITYYH